MKKTRLFLCYLGFVALMAAFAACSDGKDDKPEVDGGGGEEIVIPTKGVVSDGYYKGDHYGAGTGNLWMNFISEMKFDEQMGDYIGPGYLLCLDFNTALAESPDFAKLAEGTYTGGDTDTYAAFTLNVADGDSYVTIYNADGSSTTNEISGGTVKVTVEQGFYHLEAALKLEDGTDYSYSFIGSLTFLNRTQEGMMSNLTENKSVSGLSQALLIYYGEAFSPTSDLYTILLAGPDYNLETNYGTSDAMMIAVNVQLGTSDGIPTGTYQMIDLATADDCPVGTSLSGVFDHTYSGYYGSWFFSTKDKLESSMRNGQVTVTNRGNDTYLFSFSFKDGYNYKVEGSYSGSCRLADAS